MSPESTELRKTPGLDSGRDPAEPSCKRTAWGVQEHGQCSEVSFIVAPAHDRGTSKSLTLLRSGLGSTQDGAAATDRTRRAASIRRLISGIALDALRHSSVEILPRPFALWQQGASTSVAPDGPARAGQPAALHPGLEERTSAVHPRFDRVCQLVRLDGRRYKRAHRNPWVFLTTEIAYAIWPICVLLTYGLGTGWARGNTIGAGLFAVGAYGKLFSCSLCNDPILLSWPTLIIHIISNILLCGLGYSSIGSALARPEAMPFQNPLLSTVATGALVRLPFASIVNDLPQNAPCRLLQLRHRPSV